MGCIANTIWNYDDDRWHGYNQYNLPLTLNADWLAAYEEFVPAGSLYATCFDVCEFSYFEVGRSYLPPCPSVTEVREQNFYDLFPFPIDDSSECTDGFDERVKKHVLPSMPLYPDVCIIRQSSPEVVSGLGRILSPFVGGGAPNVLVYPLDPPVFVVYTRTVPPTTEVSQVRSLKLEIHELCHANQYFHVMEWMQPDRLTRSSGGGGTSSGEWSMTKPGSSFIELVGFTQNAAGDWRLPYDSSFRNIYSIDPNELAAELCATYFLDRMGERDPYEWTLENFDLGRYLTDEVVEWIETWVVLPAITAAKAD